MLAASLTPNPTQLIQSNTGTAAKHISYMLREFAVHASKYVKLALEVEQQQLFAASTQLDWATEWKHTGLQIDLLIPNLSYN